LISLSNPRLAEANCTNIGSLLHSQPSESISIKSSGERSFLKRVLIGSSDGGQAAAPRSRRASGRVGRGGEFSKVTAPNTPHPPAKNLKISQGPFPKGGAFFHSGQFQKILPLFSGFQDPSRVRCRRLRSAAVTRLWPRGLRSRRPHSNLISGLLGLEGISERKDSHCRSGRGGGLAKVKDPDLCGHAVRLVAVLEHTLPPLQPTIEGKNELRPKWPLVAVCSRQNLNATHGTHPRCRPLVWSW
jgi:hypothetical protein